MPNDVTVFPLFVGFEISRDAHELTDIWVANAFLGVLRVKIDHGGALNYRPFYFLNRKNNNKDTCTHLFQSINLLSRAVVFATGSMSCVYLLIACIVSNRVLLFVLSWSFF